MNLGSTCGWLALALPLAAAAVAAPVRDVPLDLSAAFNTDNWCSPLEEQLLRAYNRDHGVNTSLKLLQGGETNGVAWAACERYSGAQLACDTTNAQYAVAGDWWLDGPQAWVVGSEGTPPDGVLTGADGRVYHIASFEGNATLPGNWVNAAEVSVPADYPFHRVPNKANALSVASWHNRASFQVAGVTALLSVAQQVPYKDVNVVLGAWASSEGARNMRLSALYADDSREVLYAWPTTDPDTNATPVVRHGPCLDDSVVDSGTAGFAAVYALTQMFSDNTDHLATRGGTFFEFAAPLSLNASKALKGLVLEDVNPALNWQARGLSIYAATARRPPPPPGTVVSVRGGVGGGGVVGVVPPDAVWVDGRSVAVTPDGSFAQPFPTVRGGLGAVAPGGTVVVRGGLYREAVAVPGGTAVRPTTLMAAPGERAILSGAVRLDGWVPMGAGLYSTVLNWRPERVFVNHRPQPLAREPNEGWWVAPQVEELALVDPVNLPSLACQVTNAEVYIWTQNGNTFFTCPVVALDRAAGRLQVGRTSEWMVLTAGDKYILQNQVTMIDRVGEWAVAPEGSAYRLYYRPADTNDLAVIDAAFVESEVLGVRGVSHVRVTGMEIAGGAGNGVYVNNASDVLFSRCVFHNNRDTGLAARQCTNLRVENSVLWWNEYGLTLHTCTNAVVSENDIAHNGTDGLILSWNTADVTVQRNYIHDHLLWGHPDNLQLYREVTGARFIDNLLITGGQSVMMQETRDGEFTGNMIVGCGAYMLIFGHDSAGYYTVRSNTLAFPGYGCMNLTWRDYAVEENVFMTGHGSPMYSVAGVTNYTGNRNLFWNADRLTSKTVLVSDGGWHTTLAAFQAATKQDALSVYADPRFVNAPLGYGVLSSSALDACTRSNLVLNSSTHTFRAGDHVEINFDGVVRAAVAVSGATITIAPPLAEKPTKTWLVANWAAQADFTLDLRLRSDSPGAALGAAGGAVGSAISIPRFRAGLLDADEVRDIPAIPPELVR